LAAHKQDKYFEYHVALMESRDQKDEKTLEKIGEDLGLDVEKLRKDASSAEVNEMIEESITMASNIGIRGTPAFIVNGELFRGYLGPDGLQNEINKAQEEE
jgi:protein-disulfide isomerase